MSADRPTRAQRAALLDAYVSILHGGLSEAGGVWVPDHPDLRAEHRGAVVEALITAGLLAAHGKPPLRQAQITEEGLMEAEMLSADDRLRIAVHALDAAAPANRQRLFERLVEISGGRWDLPHPGGPRPYNPIMVSAHLFGVTAFANAPDELAINWLRAATNVIRGADAPETETGREEVE